MEADKTAYDEIYLEDVIDLHTLLFIKLTEITEYDMCICSIRKSEERWMLATGVR